MSWHIPRPTLARSSRSSKDSTSSNHSTQSAKSGSLLLTAANLAYIHQEQQTAQEPRSIRQQNLQYFLEQTNSRDELLPAVAKKPPEPDTVSVASSMHFTVVNVNARPTVRQRSFCRKHQLTILVLTMSALITIGIITAIFLLENQTDGAQRSFCRKHQLTILVLAMSALITIGIITVIFLLEMRARAKSQRY